MRSTAVKAKFTSKVTGSAEGPSVEELRWLCCLTAIGKLICGQDERLLLKTAKCYCFATSAMAGSLRSMLQLYAK